MSDIERRDAQGEDERALELLGELMSYDNFEAYPPYLVERVREYMAKAEALRSRLAEPAASTATARAKAIAAHGYLANPDDVGRVAHLLEQMESAQAAPNEDSPAISSVTLRASIAVEYETERRIAAEERAARAEAALASERAKRERPSGKVMFYSVDLGREIEVESINLKNNTFVVRPYKDALVLDGADRLLSSYYAGPAPDAAALREAIMGNFVHTHDPAPDGQEIASEWYAPKWGCDTLDHVLDDVAALLRSEPRGEEGRE